MRRTAPAAVRAVTAGLAALALSAPLLTACRGPGPVAAGAATGSPTPDPTRTATLTVFAAASLQEVFARFGADFEAAHPGTSVRFSFAGSSDLVTQLTAGAPADVLATADTTTMAHAVEAGLAAGAPAPFATNRLTIVTPPDDPASVGSFDDLARPGTRVVVCAPPVPCGAATQEVEQVTGTVLHPVSEEPSVTDVLGKVTSGEADAGLVYVTDATGAGSAVRAVPFPESAQALTTDPVVVLRGAREPALARDFATLVAGAQGRRVLRAAGFGAPPAP